MILTVSRSQLPPDITVLALNGRLIAGNTSRDVELELTHLLEQHAVKIIFDLTNLTMIDSTGVGILVFSHGKITKEGGQLRIAGSTGLVDNILKMTSVDKLVPFYPTPSEAASHF